MHRHKQEWMAHQAGAGWQACLLLFSFLVAVTPIVLTGCSSGGDRSSDRVVSGTYTFWPQFPDEPRVQYLRSYRFNEDVEPERSGFQQLVLGDERVLIQIQKPYGVDMHEGRIYICDSRANSLTILDLRGQQMRKLGVQGMGALTQPVDVAISEDGLIYVSDIRRGVIFVYSRDERHVQTLGYKGLQPAGLDVHGNRLYVADFVTNKIQILDRATGERLGEIGGDSPDTGQFIRPLGVATDDDGNVYVTDVIQCVVCKFDPDGQLVKRWGGAGNRLSAFTRPKLIEVDSEGISYIVDSGFQNVQMFNSDGQLLMFFGSAGDYPGAMSLPVGVATAEWDESLFGDYVHPGFEPRRLVLVTNQFGQSKVSLYALGELKEGYTVSDLARASVELPETTGESGDDTPPLDQIGVDTGNADDDGPTGADAENTTNPNGSNGEEG